MDSSTNQHDEHDARTNFESLARREREQLANLLLECGPNKPTLCEGWQTRDLAAHLVLREYRPDAAAGMFIKKLAGHQEAVTQKFLELDYEDLVSRFRQGPPSWNPMKLVDRLANTAENFVHHEDVRRGGGECSVRHFDPEDQRELWKVVRRMSKVMLRNTTTELTIQWAFRPNASFDNEDKKLTNTKVLDGFRVTPKSRASKGPASEGQLTGVISGEPGEILLWLFGRDKATNLTFDWSGDAAERGAKRTVI